MQIQTVCGLSVSEEAFPIQKLISPNDSADRHIWTLVLVVMLMVYDSIMA